MPTETLRPNAAGAECAISWEVGAACPNHYQNVDEAVADDADTKVFSVTGADERDLYNVEDSSGSGTIIKITVHFRCMAAGTGVPNAYAVIKSNATVTEGAAKTFAEAGVWEDFSQEWATNPAPPGTDAWTWADIDALQAGIRLVAVADGSTHCTQVYVVVDYSIPYEESASVIVGTVASAMRSQGRTRTATVIIGIVSSASRAVTWTRAASVIVGIALKVSIRTRFLRRIVSFTNRKVMDVFTNLREWINHTEIRS